MTVKEIDPIPCAIVLWCGWKSRGLLSSWIETPFDEMAWLAFLIWALAPWTCKRGFSEHRIDNYSRSHDRTLLYGAVILTIIGQLTDLRYCFHQSLVLAVAGAFRRQVSVRSFIWIASAVCWMPALGWLFRNSDEQTVILIRMALAATGLLAIQSHRLGRDKSLGQDFKSLEVNSNSCEITSSRTPRQFLFATSNVLVERSHCEA